MALARITTQFPEYSIALARSLRAQGFEVHTCAPGESTSKAADLEITLKPCAQEDRQSAMDHQSMDKDMFVVVSPGVDASKVRSIELVVLRPRAEIEAVRKDLTPAQVIVMSLGSFQGNRFNPQPSVGSWERIRAKAAAIWELACALCWHVSKATNEQIQKMRTALKKRAVHSKTAVSTKIEPSDGFDLVPSMFGLASDLPIVGVQDFTQAESTPPRSWRKPLVDFCVRRWGIVASAIAIGLSSLVVPQLWRSNATSQPASDVQQSGPTPAVAPAALVARPTASSAKASDEAAKKNKSTKPPQDDDMAASFGDDVTVRHFPRAETHGAAHPTQAVSRRVVMN